jgi:hypothetical protein
MRSSTIASHSVRMAFNKSYNYRSLCKKLIRRAFYPKIRFVSTFIPVRDCWNMLAVTSAKAKVRLFPSTFLFTADSVKNVLTKASPIMSWLYSSTRYTYLCYGFISIYALIFFMYCSIEIVIIGIIFFNWSWLKEWLIMDRYFAQWSFGTKNMPFV